MKNEDIERIQNTNKDIRYTYGFTWKNPTTNKVLITKEKAIELKPQYCELIAAGKKTIEVRKTRPKLKPPYPCEDSGGEECSVDNKKPLTRPPQSWCYVEEV